MLEYKFYLVKKKKKRKKKEDGKSSVIATNYFTTFLQIIDMANSY